MPDFERPMRQIHIDMAKDETEKRAIKAYYTGMDRARKEVAYIAAIVGAIVVFAKVMG